VRIARSIYSMPPDHGAAIVNEILCDSTSREQWTDELGAMRKRIGGLRVELVKQLAKACPERNFGFIAAQQGMFSFLGVTTPQVQALREKHHVYMTDDSRINIAGLRADNLEYFAKAVAQVLRPGSAQ
jgi:aspartate aminotransferase